MHKYAYKNIHVKNLDMANIKGQRKVSMENVYAIITKNETFQLSKHGSRWHKFAECT